MSSAREETRHIPSCSTKDTTERASPLTRPDPKRLATETGFCNGRRSYSACRARAAKICSPILQARSTIGPRMAPVMKSRVARRNSGSTSCLVLPARGVSAAARALARRAASGIAFFFGSACSLATVCCLALLTAAARDCTPSSGAGIERWPLGRAPSALGSSFPRAEMSFSHASRIRTSLRA